MDRIYTTALRISENYAYRDYRNSMAMSKLVIILSTVFLISEAKIGVENFKYKNINRKTTTSLIPKKNLVDDMKNKWIELNKQIDGRIVVIPENEKPITLGQHTLDDVERKQFHKIRRSHDKIIQFARNPHYLPSARKAFGQDVLANGSMEQKEITEKIITDAVARGADVTRCLTQFSHLSFKEAGVNLNITLCNEFERIVANAYVAAVLVNLEPKLRELEYIKTHLYSCSKNIDGNSENVEAIAAEKCKLELQKAEDRAAEIEGQVPEILESTMRTAQLKTLMLPFTYCNVEDRLRRFKIESAATFIRIQSCIGKRMDDLLKIN